MFRELFNFGFAVIRCFDFVEFAIGLIVSSVDSIDFLDGLFLTVDNVVGLPVFRTGFGNQLEFGDVVTSVDGVFRGSFVDEVFFDGLSHDDGVVIDVERSCWGDATDEITAFGFNFAVF